MIYRNISSENLKRKYRWISRRQPQDLFARGGRKIWEKEEIQRDWQIYGLGIWAALFIEPVKQNSTLEQKLYHSTTSFKNIYLSSS